MRSGASGGLGAEARGRVLAVLNSSTPSTASNSNNSIFPKGIGEPENDDGYRSSIERRSAFT